MVMVSIKNKDFEFYPTSNQTIMASRKIFILILSILSFCFNSRSQPNKLSIDSNRLKEQALKMTESFIHSDFRTFVQYTYPKLVQMMGGEDDMINFLEKGIEQMKSENCSFKSISVGLTPFLSQAGKEIHTLLSQTLIMNVPNGTLTAHSYLLAISKDGINWFFVDTTGLDSRNKILAVFPDYNFELKIPEKQLPVFHKSQ
jgi:hypothetical protein